MLWTNIWLVVIIIVLIIHSIALEKDQNAIAKGIYDKLEDIQKNLHEIRETLGNLKTDKKKK